MKESEQALAADRDTLEARIVQLTAESTALTMRITLLEEQKAQMEKDLQDDYAASIAELEAKLEEDNRKLMSLEHSEQYLKASLEDSNNKQAEQVTSLKEELEKLNGKLSSAKVATAATKWKLKAAHEAEKKAQMSRSTAAAQEAEQAWAADRDKLGARIVQLTAESTTMKESEQALAADRDKLEARIVQLTAESTALTMRITLLEEQKAQMEKDLQDDYAASIAELEAKLEEDNRKLMSLEHSEQYLKASLEDSNNKQAEQVTSLKEELEKLNGKLSSAKVATAATKWKLKAAHEAEKKAQMSRSAIFAHEAEQAWAADRDKLEARIVQLTAESTTMKESEQAWAADRDKLEARIVLLTAESTTMTTRITLLEEQKAQMEKDLQDDYAASIAELEAKLEEDNRKLMSLEHSEQYLKASLEDSNNKQAEQVTSLKEELEKLNGKLSSAKVATAATKWKLKAAHEAEKKAQMSRSAIFAHEAEQAWAADRDKLEARIVQPSRPQ